MKRKMRISAMIVTVTLLLLVACGNSRDVEQLNDGSYGVFLGIDEDNLKESEEKIAGYHTIVIDAQEFGEEQISDWKEEGHTVLSYLDVGSIETYRSYYSRFENIALDAYENWPDEYWIDVSDDSWQEYVIGLGQSLKEKGVDGFFIDNTDVYYHYPSQETYEGLIHILSGLRQYSDRVIINGGDVFVTKLIQEGKTDLISGVNQETVFSQIVNYEKDVFGRQDDENRSYYQDYLSRCAQAELDVYLLEYTTDYSVGQSAKEYCDKNGYTLYVSKKVNLE